MQSNIYTQNQVCTKMPKHNTEKGALKSNSSLTLKHKRTNIGILFQKSKILKTKGFNKDGNTKNKKYHHQEDSNNETTLKTKRLQTFQRTLSTLIGYLCNRKGVYKKRVTI